MKGPMYTQEANMHEMNLGSRLLIFLFCATHLLRKSQQTEHPANIYSASV